MASTPCRRLSMSWVELLSPSSSFSAVALVSWLMGGKLPPELSKAGDAAAVRSRSCWAEEALLISRPWPRVHPFCQCARAIGRCTDLICMQCIAGATCGCCIHSYPPCPADGTEIWHDVLAAYCMLKRLTRTNRCFLAESVLHHNSKSYEASRFSESSPPSRRRIAILSQIGTILSQTRPGPNAHVSLSC